MINEVLHIFPLHEDQKHLLSVIYPAIGLPYSECRCKPRYQEQDGNLLVIHNSFDAREWFEVDHHSRKN